MHLYQLHFDDFEPLAREVSNLLLDESNGGKTQMFRKEEKKGYVAYERLFWAFREVLFDKRKVLFLTTKSIMLT